MPKWPRRSWRCPGPGQTCVRGTDMPKRNDLDLPRIRAQALGAAIRAKRGRLSQTRLGELVGRPQATVSTWENGQVSPSLAMVGRIEEALDLPVGSLLIEAGYVSLPALRRG